jgi:hypothetical protein
MDFADDWTMKPKKRENRFAEVAGLPRVGMPPRLCHLITTAVGVWRYFT